MLKVEKTVIIGKCKNKEKDIQFCYLKQNFAVKKHILKPKIKKNKIGFPEFS